MQKRRTGRPVHPLWAHFHRGEKRNRYHYHAYCMYCVVRHGMDQVSPTRGVSADLLRHLECCSNCPRNVVESVREVCGLRERMCKAKKSDVVLQHPVPATTTTQVPLLHAAGLDAAVSEKKMPSGSFDDEPSLNSRKNIKTVSGYNANTIISSSAKRGRRNGNNETVEDVWTQWKTSLLQMAIAANIPLAAFRQQEFQHLLRVVSPVKDEFDVHGIADVSSQAFVTETATKLAFHQLTRVTKGVHHSKSQRGLTLSVTHWRTLTLEDLVAFTLVNSTGDAACVRVEEVRRSRGAADDERNCVSYTSLQSATQLLAPLADAIENVLHELDAKDISVISIVADSAVVLSAAKRVCHRARWRYLLLVPCLSTVLTSVVGCVLTHEQYCQTVGQLIDVAAYFSNLQLQTSLRLLSGETNARIPLPTRANWCTFVACVSKTLHFRDVITALCKSQDVSDTPVAPLQLRQLVLDNHGQFWKTLQELSALLAPVREAYALFFPSNVQVELHNEYDIYVNTVKTGLSLAHVMYQLSRMSQQYAALAESANLAPSTSNREATTVVARQVYEALDTLWHRYDLPTMVLAYVFDSRLGTKRLNPRNTALQWKAVSSYFYRCFHRWFCPLLAPQPLATLSPISRNKVDTIISTYQHDHFPFDRDTTSCYTDMLSYYAFVSDSYLELGALCCRVYAVALACADVRRVIRGIGFLPSVARTIARPELVELLLHVGFATNLTRTSPTRGTTTDASSMVPELIQASRPEELLCSHDEWNVFASEWKKELSREIAVDDGLERSHQVGKHQDEDDQVCCSTLNQLFSEALPPLATVVEASFSHDASSTLTQTSVAL